MQLDTTSEAIKGTAVIAGASASVLSPNEMASLAAAVLTALFVAAQMITLLPRMLDSLKELRKRFSGAAHPLEAADEPKE